MSKIDQLINQLCPDGVEYFKLGKITSSINIGINPRKFFMLNPENAEGFYVTVRELNGLQGVKEYDKTDKISLDAVRLINGRANIEVGDLLFSNTGTVGKMALVVDEPRNWSVNEGIYVIKPLKEIVDSRFLFYYLASGHAYRDYSGKFTGSTLKHVTQKALADISIPIPPLDVQSEIVRILDNFTELTAELTAELARRKEQYEYYRERLLSEGEEVKLSEIASYVSERIDAATVTEDSYIGVDNLLQNRGGKVKSEHVPIDGRIAGYRPDDILVGNIRPYLKKIWFSDCSGGTNGDVLVIRSNDPQRTFPRFLYHVLASDRFFNYDNGNSKGSKMPRGNKEAIMNYGFVLPALKDQIRIANILDKYDALCSDKLIGLPAEISARQKQYEFYRDKLLSLGA